MKYPILKPASNDMNFSRDQVVGLKKFTVGSGTNQITIIGGKMWGGSNAFSTGIFKLDLGAKTLSITGTINATAGIFSGDISLTGTLTAGASGSTIILDGTNKKITFNSDAGSEYGSLYNYTSTGGSSKSLGLNAVSGEVKLTVGGETRLVAKTDSGYPCVELYGQQKIYGRASQPLQFSSDIAPLTNEGSKCGKSSDQWSEVHSATYYCDGDEGVTKTQVGYKDDNGNNKVMRFRKGILYYQGD